MVAPDSTCVAVVITDQASVKHVWRLTCSTFSYMATAPLSPWQSQGEFAGRDGVIWSKIRVEAVDANYDELRGCCVSFVAICVVLRRRNAMPLVSRLAAGSTCSSCRCML
jgi:hypothetical protein